VNCVWDRFRDEIEEWAVQKAAADRALAAQAKSQGLGKKARGRPKGSGKKGKGGGTGLMKGDVEEGAEHTLISMDDDGGGRESNWVGEGVTDDMSEELFKDVPVGIREFMKQEKRLKEKRAREGTVG